MRPPTLPLTDSIPAEYKQVLDDIVKCLDNISFGSGTGVSDDQNIDCRFVDGTSNGVANTESSFNHNLKRTPIGFIIISKDKAGDFYNGSGHTSSQLKLKCSVASVTFKALIF